MFLILTIIAFFFYIKRIFNYFLITIIFFITSGFQLVPISVFKLGYNINKPIDYLLIILFLALIFDFKKVLKILFLDKIGRLIGLFILFIIFQCIYTNLYFDVNWENIIRASRNYLLLAYFYIFSQFKKSDLLNGLEIILTITGILCTIYIIQFFIGTKILYSTVDDEITTTYNSKIGNFTRFYNTPIFHLICYIILLNRISFNKKTFKDILLFSLICCTILLTFSRSILTICTFFFIISYLYMGEKKSYLQIGIILIFLFTFSNLFFDIAEKTFTDSVNAFKYMNINDTNTFAFRINHFYERLRHVLDNNNLLVNLFGFGFITEDTSIAQKFNFEIGIINKFQNVTQIDTTDIVWSKLIINFGILGTVVFVYFLFKIFQLQTKNSPFRVEIGYILFFGLLSSFTTIMIIENHTSFAIIYLCSINYTNRFATTELNKSNYISVLRY